MSRQLTFCFFFDDKHKLPKCKFMAFQRNLPICGKGVCDCPFIEILDDKEILDGSQINFR